MHLAAALGVPTFAVYSWGNPKWWKPWASVRHSWVRREDIACRPCAGHCIFAEPICLTGLSIDVVEQKLRDELRSLLPASQSRVSVFAD
jgi:ADP-heptose:LPS heptosyltransferase